MAAAAVVSEGLFAALSPHHVGLEHSQQPLLPLLRACTRSCLVVAAHRHPVLLQARQLGLRWMEWALGCSSLLQPVCALVTSTHELRLRTDIGPQQAHLGVVHVAARDGGRLVRRRRLLWQAGRLGHGQRKVQGRLHGWARGEWVRLVASLVRMFVQ